MVVVVVVVVVDDVIFRYYCIQDLDMEKGQKDWTNTLGLILGFLLGIAVMFTLDKVRPQLSIVTVRPHNLLPSILFILLKLPIHKGMLRYYIVGY